MGSIMGLKVCVWLALNLVLISGYGASGTNYYAAPKEEDRVVRLPGQPNVSFAQYAGYVTVNESHGRALFYWFFEATSQPSSQPLLLWLNGGPGCSSVGYGAAEELGPFRVNKDGASVSYNPYAWNNGANLLFIESPAGVGFSYSNTTDDYTHSGDAQTALDAYAFLVGWLDKFPEYKSRDFFIAGESYGGHYVPQLAKVILDNNKAGGFQINLKGILMGNSLIHDGLDTKGIVDYAWSHAILSDAFYANISSECGSYSLNESEICNSLLYEMYDIFKYIDIYGIYNDLCLGNYSTTKQIFSNSLNTKQLKSTMRIPSGGGGGYDPCMDYYVNAYFNLQSVQQALHATHTGPSFTWSSCNSQFFESWDWDNAPFSMLPTLKELMGEGLRVWMYSGDWDGRIPVLSTRYSIGSMQLPVKTDWYPWYYRQQVAGWTEVYEGLTFATVRRAGHTVPSYEPGRALALLSQFLAGSPLPPK